MNENISRSKIENIQRDFLIMYVMSIHLKIQKKGKYIKKVKVYQKSILEPQDFYDRT